MIKYSATEVKVGSFVLASVAVLLFLLFMIGAFRTTAGTYPIQIRFNYISGLEKGAPVRFGGAEVGKVERVEILSNEARPNIQVSVSVKDSIKVRQDSTAYIDTLGLMGEKYVEITPGTEASPVLPPGETFAGQDPFAINDFYKKGMTIADKIDKNLVVMEKLLENSNQLVAENRSDIETTITNLKDISVEAKELAGDLKRNPWKLLRKTKEKKEEVKEVPDPNKLETNQAPPKQSKFLWIF